MAEFWNLTGRSRYQRDEADHREDQAACPALGGSRRDQRQAGQYPGSAPGA